MADKSKDKETRELELFDVSVSSAIMEQDDAARQDARKQGISTVEALQRDSNRAENEIILFTRGMFYRAYNGSAWLVSSLFRADFRILRDRMADQI